MRATLTQSRNLFAILIVTLFSVEDVLRSGIKPDAVNQLKCPSRKRKSNQKNCGHLVLATPVNENSSNFKKLAK